jgi:hypothetical protein
MIEDVYRFRFRRGSGFHARFIASAPASSERAVQRGEPYVGFAWNLRAMIYTSDMRIRNTVCTLRGSTEETGYCDRAESVAPACELRENNNTLTTIRVKHNEARL